MPRRKALAALVAAAFALAACATADGDTTTAAAPGPNSGYDTSSIEEVPEISALVPDSVKEDGKLTIGTNLYWAPAGFYANDVETPIGYDVDLMRSLAAVMGLKPDIQQAEFASILPGIPERYELGISAFTVTAERQENFTMIQYYTVGTSWAVGRGNPSDFDPSNICGATIGVQSGTLQDEEIAKAAKSCETAPDVQRYDQQSQVTTALLGGKVDAMAADSSVVDYAIARADGAIESVGAVTGTAPQGVVVAKKDKRMAKATQAALQHLMDRGILKGIFSAWGINENVATEAAINPVKK